MLRPEKEVVVRARHGHQPNWLIAPAGRRRIWGIPCWISSEQWRPKCHNRAVVILDTRATLSGFVPHRDSTRSHSTVRRRERKDSFSFDKALRRSLGFTGVQTWMCPRELETTTRAMTASLVHWNRRFSMNTRSWLAIWTTYVISMLTSAVTLRLMTIGSLLALWNSRRISSETFCRDPGRFAWPGTEDHDRVYPPESKCVQHCSPAGDLWRRAK
nr:hypothetical protein CFP56_71002 [Quercus suber]